MLENTKTPLVTKNVTTGVGEVMPVSPSRSYRVWRRPNSQGKKIWQVKFLDEDGKVYRNLALSEARTKYEAEKLAEAELKKGVLPASNNPTVAEYLRSFWSPDSPYVFGKSIRGKPISRQYIDCNLYSVEKHVIPTLGEKHIGDLTPGMLENLILTLVRQGVGGRSINTARKALRVAVGYFFKQLNQENPLDGVDPVAENPRTRGILSLDELGAVLAISDENPKVMTAILLGALCGLRLGEIRGLLWSDVDFEKATIEVRHNWVHDEEHLKTPKWDKCRTVPVPEAVLTALKTCRETEQKESPFVMANERRIDRPMPNVTLRHGFNRVLERIGISPEVRESRNLVFHGLRHFYVSSCRSSGVPDHVVKALSGHGDMSMVERYSHLNVSDFKKSLAKLNRLSSGKRPKVAGGAV